MNNLASCFGRALLFSSLLEQLDLPARASRLSVTLTAKVPPSIFYAESKVSQPSEGSGGSSNDSSAATAAAAADNTSNITTTSSSSMPLHVTKDWHIHDAKIDREIDDLHLRTAGKGYTLYVLGR